LANPGLLPAHPLLVQDRLAWRVLQEQARDYERMLMVLCQRQLRQPPVPQRIDLPLRAHLPSMNVAGVTQGHYRIGARGDPAAYDDELPPQAVELSSFRIARYPVTNAEFLAFMEHGGYNGLEWWDEAGRDWAGAIHPEYWERDARGNWFGVSINGAAALDPGQPVLAVNQHEARAYAAWAASLGGALAGAVVQHEC
jgi:iron(II)-dependent oxidoreductase